MVVTSKICGVSLWLLSLSSAYAFAPKTLGISKLQLTSSSSVSSSPSFFQLYARKPFISGNWKLNPQTRDEATSLAKGISESITADSPDVDVALFVPYVFIEAAMEAVSGTDVMIGAETICPEGGGAFTGAISASMVKSVGVQWALAGHSERRVINGESDEYINEQVKMLLESGMSVMLCIGESESEYEQNLAGPICSVQLRKGLAGVSEDQLDRVAIAYEPVWAIGTGKVATPDIAQSVHATCRSILADMYDDETADKIRILYGGSVSPESVDGLMSQPDIDGTLVGGASLDAAKFGRIINFVSEPVPV